MHFSTILKKTLLLTTAIIVLLFGSVTTRAAETYNLIIKVSHVPSYVNFAKSWSLLITPACDRCVPYRLSDSGYTNIVDSGGNLTFNLGNIEDSQIKRFDFLIIYTKKNETQSNEYPWDYVLNNSPKFSKKDGNLYFVINWNDGN